jgi:hypothetical protein
MLGSLWICQRFLDRQVGELLVANDVRLVALRSAGFNHVDVRAVSSSAMSRALASDSHPVNFTTWCLLMPDCGRRVESPQGAVSNEVRAQSVVEEDPGNSLALSWSPSGETVSSLPRPASAANRLGSSRGC